jgi:putative ABC transport system permease protein
VRNAGKQRFSKPHLWLIGVIGVIVPRRLRTDWRQEWEAELRYRELLLADWDKLDWRHKLDLLRRSIGAFWDALLLQPKRLEDEMFQDLRFGLRMLRKHPGFTAIAVLTLALGIGINAAIFSVVDGVLLRPLPYPQADQLVRIWSANQATGQRYLETSYQDFQQFKQQSRAFASMAAFSYAPRVLRDEQGEPSHITVARVSNSFCAVLGLAPALGRDLSPEEMARGERSVMLSHRLWQSRYAAKPDVLSRSILIDGQPHTVVGVMPPSVSYPRTADLWRPLTEAEKEDDDPEYSIIARRAPGATLQQADAEISTIAQRIAQTGKEKTRTAWVQTMQAMVVREVQTPLLVLLGAVALVLLIACANVASLLLARGLARGQEIAIRAALGAGRWRIVRQLLTESILIAALGGVVGLLLGAWALRAFVLLGAENIPRLNEVALDGRVIAVMIAVTTLAGIIFGLAPAFQSARLDLHNALKSGNRNAGGSKHHLRQGLVIAEIALATVLVISAGLLIKSFSRLLSFDRGFRAENVLVVPLNLRGQDNPQFVAFFERVLAETRALPGVESAALASRTPLAGQGLRFPFSIEGRPALPPQQLPQAVVGSITAEYFKTVGIPLLAGRAFNEQDRAGGPAVAIINQTLAKSFFAHSEPVGQRLQSEGQSILIVGVAADVTPEAGAASRPVLYRPFSQFPLGGSLLLRTTSDPLSLVSTVRARIWALNPLMPLDQIYTLEQRVLETAASPRLTMLLVGLFAALGLALALVGIYGVMSYAVTERTREIGIRRALGAQEAAIVWAMLHQGVRLTALGLVIGLALSVGATRLLTTLLFNVSANDPLTFAGVASLLSVVALVACYLPARRATKVDPLVALRHE